jgi:chaperonin GroEL (HSP60 family)
VLIEKKWGMPLVCNDGVTIAKEVDLRDAEEYLGAQMIREAAERTGEAVGDGTSTATVLAHAIIADGLRNIAAGASGVELKRGLDRGLRVAVETVRSLSRSVESRREKAQVATISAHNDSSLGELVADAMEKVGSEGVVSVEEAKTTETALEVVQGMQIDRGYLSPYFITDAEKMEAVLEDAVILLHEKKISTLKELVPILEQEIRSPIDGEVLQVFRESEGAVGVGERIMELGDRGNLEVEIDVLSADAVRIAPGAKVYLEHWGSSKPLMARVRLIEPQAFLKVSALGVEEQRVNLIADFTTRPNRGSDWAMLTESRRESSSRKPTTR